MRKDVRVIDDSRVVAERGPFEMVPHWILYDREISAQAVRLYLVLRQHADSVDLCFPSRQRLAELLDISLPTLDKAREQLVTSGALCMAQRKGSRQQWVSNLYHVHWQRNLDCRMQETLLGSKEYGALTYTHRTTTQEKPSTLVATVTISSETQALTHSGTLLQAGERGRQDYSADFAQFWEAYPRKAGKRAAWQAWQKALRHEDAHVIVAAAARYARDPNREQRFTAHPASWLNAGRWDDEPLPSRSSGSTGGERRLDSYKSIYEKLTTRAALTDGSSAHE